MLLVWLPFILFVLNLTAASMHDPNSTTFSNKDSGSNLVHGGANYHSTADYQNEERNNVNSTTEGMSFRNLARSTSGNAIDDCWRYDPNWHNTRKRLADCVIGFGQAATGGKHGKFYVVTDPSDHDPVNPKPGTLRYAVIQASPLWIIFQRDMVIQLKQELIMNSFKTIDGRGANVHIAHGPCITIQYVSHVIIHGIHIHDCKPGGPAIVRSSPTQAGWRTISDGDGISIFGARNIWIDHCTLSRATDGLLDAIEASTAMTISNNLFTHHNKVMLLGHSDAYKKDRVMRVTVVYNHFGEGLIQRMPRCRYGVFHIVNNKYSQWGMYAIGGSANPTIYSQGNQFVASENPNTKEVTKRELATDSVWRNWNWKSEGDIFHNGAFFKPSGSLSPASYAKVSSIPAKPAALVDALTASAGTLQCRKGRRC